MCFEGKGEAMNGKEAETHCAALGCSQTTLLTPVSGASGSLFCFLFPSFCGKKKNVFGNRGNLFCKMILFSPILAIGDSTKMKAWN